MLFICYCMHYEYTFYMTVRQSSDVSSQQEIDVYFLLFLYFPHYSVLCI